MKPIKKVYGYLMSNYDSIIAQCTYKEFMVKYINKSIGHMDFHNGVVPINVSAPAKHLFMERYMRSFTENAMDDISRIYKDKKNVKSTFNLCNAIKASYNAYIMCCCKKYNRSKQQTTAIVDYVSSRIEYGDALVYDIILNKCCNLEKDYQKELYKKSIVNAVQEMFHIRCDVYEAIRLIQFITLDEYNEQEYQDLVCETTLKYNKLIMTGCYVISVSMLAIGWGYLIKGIASPIVILAFLSSGIFAILGGIGSRLFDNFDKNQEKRPDVNAKEIHEIGEDMKRLLQKHIAYVKEE